ncbi:MAG: hypothetical protein J7499_03710 [Sphingopyxis sp.]|nr:hypothetical protein [Sphingopyxis sp.]
MTRLIASLFAALALLVSPLATSNAAAMPAMTACTSTMGESGCPDSDDSETRCTPAVCVSLCGSFCPLPPATERHLPAPAAKIACGPPARLAGITPEAEIRPPRTISEI